MSSPDRLEVDTVAMETAGLQLAGIRSESTTASELANAIIGSVAPPDAGLGIGDAVSAMGRAWAEGLGLIGDELAALGGKVQQGARVYQLVERSAIGTFPPGGSPSGHPAI